MSISTLLWIAMLGAAPDALTSWLVCERAFDDALALDMPPIGPCRVPLALGEPALWLVQPPCSLAPLLEASAGDAEPLGAVRVGAAPISAR